MYIGEEIEKKRIDTYAASVGVLTISAPNALRTSTFSLLIFSGIVMMHR